MAGRIEEAGGPVLLLGVPTVALALRRSDVDLHVVHEENAVGEGLWKALSNRARTNFALPGPGTAAAAMLDPPWYLPAYEEMLHVASIHCRLGAPVWVGVPPVGARPRAVADRESLVAIAERCGLDLVDREAAATRYRTPLFEANALEAAGIAAALPQWRTGDLFTFVKSRRSDARAPVAREPSFELTLGGIRLRLLARAVPDSRLEPAVFPHVSIRASGRERFNLWTSGNRVLAVEPLAGLDALMFLAGEAGLQPEPGSVVPAAPWSRNALDRSHPLIHQLRETLALEDSEAEHRLGASGWERTLNDARFLNGSRGAFLVDPLGLTV